MKGMEDEKYIEELDKQNGYCDCEGLKELFDKRRKAEKIGHICDFFQENLDFDNPSEGDLKGLLQYRESLNEFHLAIDDYHCNLEKCIGDKRVKLVKSLREKVFSYNCSNCNQQIDVMPPEKENC